MIEENTHKLNDEQIVRLILDNKEPAYFEIIYDRYARKIYNKCLNFVNEKMLAQDLTHDILLKVYLNLNSFSFKSKFSTWLYSVMYNFCASTHREIVKHRSEIGKYFHEEPNIHEENPDELLFQLKVDRLKTLLEQLSMEDRMILLLKYQDDFSIKDIKSVTALSESAIKMRLKRAKEKVLQLYREKYTNNIM